MKKKIGLTVTNAIFRLRYGVFYRTWQIANTFYQKSSADFRQSYGQLCSRLITIYTQAVLSDNVTYIEPNFNNNNL